ncbi:unnamed protein product [Brassica rapa subsp. narinosa]
MKRRRRKHDAQVCQRVEAGESFRVQTQMWELFGTQCRWLSPTTQLLLQTDYRM